MSDPVSELESLAESFRERARLGEQERATARGASAQVELARSSTWETAAMEIEKRIPALRATPSVLVEGVLQDLRAQLEKSSLRAREMDVDDPARIGVLAERATLLQLVEEIEQITDLTAEGESQAPIQIRAQGLKRQLARLARDCSDPERWAEIEGEPEKALSELFDEAEETIYELRRILDIPHIVTPHTQLTTQDSHTLSGIVGMLSGAGDTYESSDNPEMKRRAVFFRLDEQRLQSIIDADHRRRFPPDRADRRETSEEAPEDREADEPREDSSPESEPQASAEPPQQSEGEESSQTAPAEASDSDSARVEVTTSPLSGLGQRVKRVLGFHPESSERERTELLAPPQPEVSAEDEASDAAAADKHAKTLARLARNVPDLPPAGERAIQVAERLESLRVVSERDPELLSAWATTHSTLESSADQLRSLCVDHFIAPDELQTNARLTELAQRLAVAAVPGSFATTHSELAGWVELARDTSAEIRAIIPEG